MESPFLDLLDTNYCPSDEDIPGIRTIIQEHTRAANVIDREIGPLILTISGLIKRQLSHVAFARRHAALLEPIRGIPDEILSVIFVACLPPSDDRQQPPMSRTHPAVVLSHVCRRWRQLSTSTPSLWTSIILTLPIYPCLENATWNLNSTPGVYLEAGSRWEARMDHLLEMCRVWLARSAEAPLTVLLWGTARSESVRPNVTDRVAHFINVLCGAAHRWMVADISLNFGTMAQPQEVTPVALSALVNLGPGDVPLLKSLHLNIYHGFEPHYDGGSLVDHASTRFLRTPTLRSLRLDSISCPWASMDVDWSSLTHLRFGGYSAPVSVSSWTNPLFVFSWVEAFLLLGACTRLISCDLAIPHVGWEDPLTPPEYLHAPTLILPSLESLTLRDTVPREQFLDRVDFPSLRSLRFAGTTRALSTWGQPSDRRDEGAFLKLLRRFGHQLLSVSFQFPNITDALLSSLLEELRYVESLDIVATYIPPSPWGQTERRVPSFAHLLTPVAITAKDELIPPFCPKLKKLRFDVALDGSALDEEGILNMIAARRVCWGGEGLALIDEVHIDFGLTQTMDIPMELQARNVDVEGFRFTATYIPPIRLTTFNPDLHP